MWSERVTCEKLGGRNAIVYEFRILTSAQEIGWQPLAKSANVLRSRQPVAADENYGKAGGGCVGCVGCYFAVVRMTAVDNGPLRAP